MVVWVVLGLGHTDVANDFLAVTAATALSLLQVHTA